MKKTHLTQRKLNEIIRKTVKTICEEYTDNVLNDIDYKIERLSRLQQILSEAAKYIKTISEQSKKDIAEFIEGEPINIETSMNEVSIKYRFSPEQAKRLILSNKNIIDYFTGDFGDYEGENMNDVLSDRNEFMSIVDNLLDNKGHSYGHGFSVSYSIYNNIVSINIDTPINWDGLDSLNEIMDF